MTESGVFCVKPDVRRGCFYRKLFVVTILLPPFFRYND